MQCPKCKTDNPETATYCVRCHAPLRYTCPSCKNVQSQGGKCEKCGLDFAKYAAMLVFQAKDVAKAEREKLGWHPGLWVEVLIFPIPFIVRLVQYFERKSRSR